MKPQTRISMNGIDKFLTKIPVWLSSKVSIFIYLFLFVYLVVFALLAFVIPAIHDLAPSSDTQLVLGNYTNVLSALGASIAAGSGVSIHRAIKKHQQTHKQLQHTIDRLHEKIDILQLEIDELVTDRKMARAKKNAAERRKERKS